MKNRNLALVGMILGLALSACGKKNEVTISSTPPSGGQMAVRLATSDPITEFKLCVDGIKLEDENGQPVKPEAGDQSDDDSNAVKFAPGLIDVLSATDWGQVTLPQDFKLSKLRIKIHKNDALCQNLGGSMKINGVVIQPDIEFRFAFSPALTVDGTTKQFTVSFAKVADAIKAAWTQIQASPDSIKSVIEGVDGDVAH